MFYNNTASLSYADSERRTKKYWANNATLLNTVYLLSTAFRKKSLGHEVVTLKFVNLFTVAIRNRQDGYVAQKLPYRTISWRFCSFKFVFHSL